MDLVRLFIKRISYNQSQNDAFVLIMHELESDLKLPIVIGAFEAQSIALELEKNIIPPRPLTHDLFKIFADAFHIKVKRVVIYKLEEGIFYSNMLCIQNGEEENDGTRNRYSKYSLTELKKMLNDCIENEDYEIAAHIRDEISKRNSTF